MLKIKKNVALSSEMKIIEKANNKACIPVYLVAEIDDRCDIYLPENSSTFDNQFVEGFKRLWPDKDFTIYYVGDNLTWHEYRDFARELFPASLRSKAFLDREL